ncbi:MAG: hypothetical protein QW335_06965 [Candidatus Nezhaarchaeales archaeon]
MGRDAYSLIGSIVMWFLELWNRRRIVLPLLFLATLASWMLIGVVPRTYAFVLGSFFAAITITVVFLTFLLLGTVVIDSIEAGFIPLERVPRVVVGSLIAIFAVIGVLLYLALMLVGAAPPLLVRHTQRYDCDPHGHVGHSYPPNDRLLPLEGEVEEVEG